MYYPFLEENVFFGTLKRFAMVMQDLNFALFYFLLDIVPIFVYYHSTKHIETIEIDVKMMLKTSEENDNHNISKGLSSFGLVTKIFECCYITLTTSLDLWSS